MDELDILQSASTGLNNGVKLFRKGGYLTSGKGKYSDDSIKGWFLGNDKYDITAPGTPKVNFGDTNSYLKWDGTEVKIKGRITVLNPEDFETISSSTQSGAAVNLMHFNYGYWHTNILPPVTVANGTAVISSDTKVFGNYSLKLNATGADNYCYFGTSSTDYNIPLTPEKTYILSAYVRSTVAGKTCQLYLKDSSGSHYGVFQTLTDANVWYRVSGVVGPIPADRYMGIIRVDNDGGSGVSMYFDGVMLEEQTGTGTTPSAYSMPPSLKHMLEVGTEISGGGITLTAGGALKSNGMTNETPLSTGGVWLGYNSTSSKYTFGAGDSSNYIKWDGSALLLKGNIDGSGLLISKNHPTTPTYATITGGELNIGAPQSFNSSHVTTTGTSLITGYYWNGSLWVEAFSIDLSTTLGGSLTIYGNALHSGRTTTYSAENLAVGYTLSMRSATYSGRQNTALGKSTMEDVTTGSYNTGVGYHTLLNLTTGSYNSAFGVNALGNGVIIGNNNTACGYGALSYLTSGADNTTLGAYAGFSITTSIGNVAIGKNSLYTLSTTAEGNNNVCIGVTSGYYLKGSDNVAIGLEALKGVSGSTTGASSNIAIGSFALSAITTGDANICIGKQSGEGITSGTYNTCIGHGAGYNGLTNSNITCLGYLATPSSNSVTNEITLGNSSITTLRCQVTTITALSDKRDKKNIKELDAGIEFIKKLKPSRFIWNARDKGKVGIEDIGFIAQDLKEAQEETKIYIPNLVYESNPDRLEAGYGALLPVLVKAIQEQQKQIEELKELLKGNK